MIDIIRLLVVIILGCSSVFANEKISDKFKDELLSAYLGMQYNRAKELVRKNPESTESQVILSLCDVFNRRNQRLQSGLKNLTAIYKDESIAKPLRIQAGLSLARAAQTLCMRDGLYQFCRDIDYKKIYREIIRLSPQSISAVTVALYLSQDFFVSEQPGDGLQFLTEFIHNFSGDKALLAPIHYMLCDQYIIQKKDYTNAVRELEKMRTLGITNPRNKPVVSFRIARIYDVYLSDKEKAIANYNAYLKDFPDSKYVPVVKRYLEKLQDGDTVDGR